MKSPVSSPGPALGEVVVSRKGAQRLRPGHPWVFRPDVTRVPDPSGPFVLVVDESRNPVSICLFSPTGALALRRWGPPGCATDASEAPPPHPSRAPETEYLKGLLLRAF